MKPIDSNTHQEINALLKCGNKIHAIKTIREATGYDLKEAKEMAEAMEKAIETSSQIVDANDFIAQQPTSTAVHEAGLDEEIAQLLMAGDKIDAVTLMRNRTGCSLSEAAGIVDAAMANLPAKESRPIETDYSIPFSLGVIQALFDPRMKKAATATRLARKLAVPGSFSAFRYVAASGRDPIALVERMSTASRAGYVIDLRKFMVADFTLQSEERLRLWVAQGMPELHSFMESVLLR